MVTLLYIILVQFRSTPEHRPILHSDHWHTGPLCPRHLRRTTAPPTATPPPLLQPQMAATHDGAAVRLTRAARARGDGDLKASSAPVGFTYLACDDFLTRTIRQEAEMKARKEAEQVRADARAYLAQREEDKYEVALAAGHGVRHALVRSLASGE